ncbi:MAG: terpene cyclase/mutase family protein [Planctomycetes bacterium]|nr:terpene cyclase/mutase family protein [Planctomycetota bacterium]
MSQGAISDSYDNSDNNENAYEDDSIFDNEMQDYDENNDVSPAPAWLMSLAVHGLLAIIMMGIIFGQMPEDEDPPIRIAQFDHPEDDPEPVKEKLKLEEVKIDIDVEKITEQPVVEEFEVEIEEIADVQDPVDEQDVAQNREDAVSVSEMSGAVAFMAIGAGNNSAGKYGRNGKGKRAALGEFGGSKASEKSVEAALRWFKKHQTVEGLDKGMWDVDGYMTNCQDNVKCEPGTAHTAAGGDGDSACTAYAVLCFLGSGYDHKTIGEYRATVAMGIEWLKTNQRDDGGFGKAGRNYENGVCTMAICEAYGMTMDPKLRDTAQRAVDNLISRQAKSDKFEYGIGWNYAAATATRNDSSVTGWCVMALKAAKAAGLDVGSAWDGSRAWLDAAWKASNPGVDPASLGSDSQSNFCYTYDAIADVAKGKKLECVGALCAIFLGTAKGDGMLDSMINTIMDKQIPQAYPCNTYYLYYNTLNIFQYGGVQWDDWNMQVRDMLVDAQHGADSGCFEGSWDYEGTKFHGHETGRLLSTAYCCLSLEVYYRHARIMKLQEKFK